MRILFCFIFSAFALSTAHARPVSYPGGWTAMLSAYGDKKSAHIHYSPAANVSVGYRLQQPQSELFTLHAVQINNLLKRWNQKDSQANIYLKSGVGVTTSDVDSLATEAGFTGLAMDWEDRRYFVSYENRYTKLNGVEGEFEQSARVGWAPYEGDYGDLHTWLMLQVNHFDKADNSVVVTPLVRLFKGVHLFEAGYSDQDDILLNYIFRY